MGMGLLPRRGEAALESFATCPVCDQEHLIWGPDGVMVHLLADHAERSDVRWLMQQREEPATQLEVLGNAG
jgi:hypothetical protein